MGVSAPNQIDCCSFILNRARIVSLLPNRDRFHKRSPKIRRGGVCLIESGFRRFYLVSTNNHVHKEGVEFSRVFVWNPDFSNFPSVVPILLNRCLLFCAFCVLSKVRAMRVWNEIYIPHKDNNANPTGVPSL